jgi:hypothetical protein
LNDDNTSGSGRLKKIAERYNRYWTLKGLKNKTLKDQNLSSPLVELTLDDGTPTERKQSKCVALRNILDRWYKNNCRCIRSVGRLLFPLDSNYE